MGKHTELPEMDVIDCQIIERENQTPVADMSTHSMDDEEAYQVAKEIVRRLDAYPSLLAEKAAMLEALERVKNYNIDLRNMINGLGIDLEADRNSVGIVLGRQRGALDAAIAIAKGV